VTDPAGRPWLAFGRTLLSQLSLDPIIRELAILQLATTATSDYERVQHQAVARGVGATPTQISAVVSGNLDSSTLGDIANVLRAVDELTRTHTVTAKTFGSLRDRLSEQQVVELLLVVGYYLGIAMLAAAVDLDPDTAAGMSVIAAAQDLDQHVANGPSTPKTS